MKKFPFYFAFVTILFFVLPAWADGASGTNLDPNSGQDPWALFQLLFGVGRELWNILRISIIISGCIGLAFTLLGLLKIRQHAIDSQNTNHLRHGIILLILGGLLFSVPLITLMTGTSLFGSSPGPVVTTAQVYCQVVNDQYDQTKGGCIPPPTCDGGIWNGSNCMSCPQGQVPSSDGTHCVCQNPGQTLVGGVCQCPQGQTWNGNACACPQGQSWNGSACACPQGQSWNGSACACPQGQSWNGSACACPQGQNWNGSACACPQGQSWNGSACACPQGQSWNGSACACPSGQSLNSSGSCQCNPGTYLNADQTCVSCQGGEYANAQGVCVPCASGGSQGVGSCQYQVSITSFDAFTGVVVQYDPSAQSVYIGVSSGSDHEMPSYADFFGLSPVSCNTATCYFSSETDVQSALNTSIGKVQAFVNSAYQLPLSSLQVSNVVVQNIPDQQSVSVELPQDQGGGGQTFSYAAFFGVSPTTCSQDSCSFPSQEALESATQTAKQNIQNVLSSIMP